MNTVAKDEIRAIEQTEDDVAETIEITEQHLTGQLLKRLTWRFKTLMQPFSKLSEQEQENFLKGLAGECSEAVAEVVRVIASGDRLNFRAHVESVTFKDGVKATLTLPNTPESHALADAQGRSIMVVIEDSARYLQLGDAVEGQPDQPALFEEDEDDDPPLNTVQ